jgi:hypothetical protein
MVLKKGHLAVEMSRSADRSAAHVGQGTLPLAETVVCQILQAAEAKRNLSLLGIDDPVCA